MKIKSIIILACMMLSCSIGAKAQSYEYPKHEVSLGYGVVGMTDISSLFADIFVGAFTGSVELDVTGEFNAQYLYNLNKTWGVGCAATYTSVTAHNIDRTCKEKDNFIAVMPAIRANWFRKAHFGMYTRIAVGGVMGFSKTTHNAGTPDAKEESNTYTNIAFQASPIGMEFGSNKFSGFLELGFGMQGMLMAGVRLGL